MFTHNRHASNTPMSISIYIYNIYIIDVKCILLFIACKLKMQKYISVYHVKYSMLLISDVIVIVVRQPLICA